MEESIGTDSYNLVFQEQHENSTNDVSSQNGEDKTASTIQSTPSTQSTTNSFKNRQQRTSDSKFLGDLKEQSAEHSAFITEILKDEDKIDIFMRSIAVKVKSYLLS